MMTLEQARHELLRHGFDTFVDAPPPISQGGKGVVVPGCPACRKPLQSINQLMQHLADDVLPVIVNYQREPGEEG